MQFEFLETARLQLKIFRPEHFAYIFSNFSAEQAMLQLGLKTIEDYEREKRKSDTGFVSYDRTLLHFKLIVKDGGNVIGGGGFHNWSQLHRRSEFGYALTEETAKRKGYMTEAALAMIAYGFNKLNLNRMEAFVSPQNQASLRLITKLGFKQEGIMREHFIREEQPEDSVIFALLKSENTDRTR